MEYRREQELPFVGLRAGDGVILEVRLKKRSMAKKMEIASGRGEVAREAVFFPRAGTIINLEPTKRLRTITTNLSVRVNAVQPRKADANVARLICSVN